MESTRAVLAIEDTPIALYVSFELGDKSWILTFSDGRRSPGRFTLAAGDQVAVLARLARAKALCALAESAAVYSCYEAGRDGWWLHRWLGEQGVHNIVVDSASIEVNRRSRRAKSDRLDGDKLLQMLWRHRHGERVWSVLHEPSEHAEDERRVHRELQRLTQEATAHANRIGALLVLHNLRVGAPVGGRIWAAWWAAHQQQLAPRLRAEIERECARLALAHQQILSIRSQCRQELAPAAEPGSPNDHAAVRQLCQLRGIAERSAWVLDKELFAWRHFDNRRQLGACIGLTPTPYASGASAHEQGISKAGNKRVRYLLVELAWGWLRWQPHSELTLWFNRRFASGGKRMRRIGIVALARRLLIALWRYLQSGEIPAGATLKLATAPTARA
jgi:transposase